MALGRDPRAAGPPRPGPPEPQTATSRGWKALNLSDDRLSIDDDELAWLENGMWLGRAIQSVPLYAGAAGAVLKPGSTVKASYGCSLTFGPNTIPHPVAIVVFEDGSAWQRDLFNDVAVDVQVAAPATFSSSPYQTGIAIWRTGPVLLIDEQTGYFSWNGVTLTTISATRTGPRVVVFESHAWLQTAPRTVTYTAPNTFDDFVAGNGAGSFQITDEAFDGQIQGMLSTVEQLWLLSQSAVDALGNVATAAGVTTFTITNALTSLGTVFPESLIGYFRAMVFATGYSIHALLGVTPQKLSAKIDRLFPVLSAAITFGPKSGIQMLNGAVVLVFLYSFTPSGATGGRSELLCFQEGRWFLATTPDLGGNRVLDLVTLTIHNAPEVYGIDAGGFLYRIFARSTDAQKGTMTVSSKLFELGDPVEGHQSLRVALDLSAPAATASVAVTVTLTTEAGTVVVGNGPFTEKFFASLDSPLGFRYALLRRDAPILGQRVGWTVSLPCSSGVALEAAHLEVSPTGKWETVDAA